MRWTSRGRPAHSPAPPRRSRADSSSKCCCPHPRCALPAEPTRSCATSSPSACWACPVISVSTRTCRSTRSRPREGRAVKLWWVSRSVTHHFHPLNQKRSVTPSATPPYEESSHASQTMDAAVKQKGRIGVLEELLNARYSVRAFLPKPVPRDIIEQVLKVAQRTASWCNSQPWQVVIASAEAKERFRKLIYKEAASGAKDDHDFTPPGEYLGVYLERRRESGFQLYNTLGIPRGDKVAYAKQALENYNFFGAPHVAIIHTTEPLGAYGAVDCGAYVSNFML